MWNNNNRGLFEKTITIQGKHARIHRLLMDTGLFSHNHEAVEFAMMTGLALSDGKERKDTDSSIEVKVQKDTMRDIGDKIIKLYRFCMLLHDPFIDHDERISRAFDYDDRGIEAAQYEEILEGYMRNGYIILEEKILNSGPHSRKKMQAEDYIRNEYALLNEIDKAMAAKLSSKKEAIPLTPNDILIHA